MQDRVENMAAFREAYANLNAAQREAVDAIEGPVMVVAGPGTGKTTILTLRIANILQETDTPPSGILAITFTDAGVKAMRKKLQEVIGTRAHEVHISTFHGFAAAMMAEYPDHFLHTADLRPITDVEQESLIRSIIEGPLYTDLRPSGRPDAYIASILRTIDEAKRDAFLPEDVRAYAEHEIERIRSDESSLSTRGTSKGKLKATAEAAIKKCERTILLAGVYTEYEKRKREAGLLDFNDLIIEFLAALKTDKLLLRLIQERFLYILVDEHQDTNDAQNFIVELLAEFFDTPNVFIVGDEKQAIYRFQGASVENFLALRKRWPDMRVVSLTENYRSHQDILDAAFSMIEKNYEGDEYQELRVPLRSADEDVRRPIDVVSAENAAAADRYLVEEIRTLIEHEPDATIAIMTRRNRELERVLRVLEGAGIPVSSERSIDIFTHSVGAAFFDLLEYFADPTRTDALARTMIAGLWGLTIEEAAEYVRYLRSGRPIELEKRLPALAVIRRELSGDGAVGFIVDACRHAGFTALTARDPASVNVWRGIVALSETIARERRLTSPLSLIEALLAYRRSSELKTVKVAVGAPDMAVKAMTAHASKGLEFDYVFLPHATEEAWVGRARGASFVLPRKQASGDDIHDTRRLFYVALTRARAHATIIVPLEESDGRVLTPLRFIDELATGSVSHTELPRADTELPESSEVSACGANEAVTALAKQRLLTSGLSVTALNHFLNDPKIFLTESILRVPQAPSVSAEKGNAMHAAMDRLWCSGETKPERVSTLIVEAVNAYLDESFLSSVEKEAVRTELVEAAPAVATALQEHLSMERSAVFTEHWVETEFSYEVSGEYVTIPLHGKLDAVIERDNDIFVFDYKTRQGMSIAAARGETKSTNGDYFRQLVFYKLLLRESPRWKGKTVETSLVFLSPDRKGLCPILTLPVTETDIKMMHEHIGSLIEYVWSMKLGEIRL